VTRSSTWVWRLRDVDGRPVRVDLDPPELTGRFDAELWLGTVWRDLADAGAASATLERDGDVVSIVAVRAYSW
jgi:hypothetical protein